MHSCTHAEVLYSVVCRVSRLCSCPHGGQGEYPCRIGTPPLALDYVLYVDIFFFTIEPGAFIRPIRSKTRSNSRDLSRSRFGSSELIRSISSRRGSRCGNNGLRQFRNINPLSKTVAEDKIMDSMHFCPLFIVAVRHRESQVPCASGIHLVLTAYRTVFGTCAEPSKLRCRPFDWRIPIPAMNSSDWMGEAYRHGLVCITVLGPERYNV
jgi:hypothetical protein